MFNKLKNAHTLFEAYMTRRGRVAAHEILMKLSDRSLEDIGISRSELLGGVQNWPWDGTITAEKETSVSQYNNLKTQKAIRELSQYSDRELHDIGINRGMIADAVVNGRVGIDDQINLEHVSRSNQQAA